MSVLEKDRVTRAAAIWVISPGVGDPLPKENEPVNEQVACSESEQHLLNLLRVLGKYVLY